MLFEEVRQLIPNQVYKMKWEEYEYKGTFSMYDIEYAIFKNVNIKKVKLPILYLKLVPDIGCTFYQPIFKKENIQWNMERRAVNLILQRILGDPCFHW